MRTLVFQCQTFILCTIDTLILHQNLDRTSRLFLLQQDAGCIKILTGSFVTPLPTPKKKSSLQGRQVFLGKVGKQETQHFFSQALSDMTLNRDPLYEESHTLSTFKNLPHLLKRVGVQPGVSGSNKSAQMCSLKYSSVQTCVTP